MGFYGCGEIGEDGTALQPTGLADVQHPLDEAATRGGLHSKREFTISTAGRKAQFPVLLVGSMPGQREATVSLGKLGRTGLGLRNSKPYSVGFALSVTRRMNNGRKRRDRLEYGGPAF